jgi:hypothetical protein
MAVLQEFLAKKGFYVLRTAELDDYINKIDLLIFDKRTGTAVCGVDNAQSLNSIDKKTTADEKNKVYGGARIKYGLVPQKDNKGEIKFQPGKMENVPILVFSSTEKDVEFGIENFGTTQDEKLFKNFVNDITEQINRLSNILQDKESKLRLFHFKESLVESSKKKESIK